MRSTLLCVLACIVTATSLQAADDSIPFYIGTATNADRGGIFISSLSLKTGELSEPKRVAATDRSTFICLHPTQPVLYSVAELNDGVGKGAGILAWKVDPTSGDLTEISRQPAGGEGACFVIARRDGKYAAIANYGSGSISLYPLEKDGRIQTASANIQHQGSGPVANRQSEPHAHSVRFDAAGSRLLAADLGTDDIFIYDIVSDGSLKPSSPPSLEMPAGSGPRHFVFSPDKRFVLGLGEISGVISTFAMQPINATPLFTVSTMAEGSADDAVRASAEILFHPTLPVVYCSNRGPHEIAVFDYEPSVGKLMRRSSVACGGEVPRNFRFSPDGRFLLVCNQASNNIAVFSVNSTTGDLTPSNHQISIPAPMCIKFVGDMDSQ